jgi:uncharacterized protein (DUF924 family)
MNAQAVLDFWFGDDDAPRNEWFRKDVAFDAQVAQRFADLIERALGGELRDWQAEPASALARILLLDQFTRNTLRNTARAFAGDALALEAARAMLSTSQYARLAPVRRAFVILPFEHAEDIAAQDDAVRLFTALAEEAPALAGMLDYAQRHRAVIARFGRFPHRNALLGRVSTPDETAFLREPGSSF